MPDVAEMVAAHPERFVLKRAWDYGGKAVFLGRAAQEPGFDERVRAADGKSMGWRELCARASEDLVGGGFVAQEVVNLDLQSHLVCSGSEQVRTDLYVDFSAYASVGLRHAPAWGAACRGSPSQIVNIVGGGGVLPLITAEVFQRLEAALTRR